jgi:hypothetical protein
MQYQPPVPLDLRRASLAAAERNISLGYKAVVFEALDFRVKLYSRYFEKGKILNSIRGRV